MKFCPRQNVLHSTIFWLENLNETFANIRKTVTNLTELVLGTVQSRYIHIYRFIFGRRGDLFLSNSVEYSPLWVSNSYIRRFKYTDHNFVFIFNLSLMFSISSRGLYIRGEF